MSPDRPTGPIDPVEDYLDQLYVSLHTTPRQARRILAEAEDHLREATAVGVEAGLSEREAQEAAVSSFGSVRAVVRAHARRVPPVAVLGELVMSAWKLTSIAVLAVAGSGLVAFAMNEILGPRFVGGNPSPADRALSLSACTYWMNIWTHAQSCSQAAMLETSSDAVTLRLLTLIPGLVLLGGYLLARRYQRQRGWRADLLPEAFVPTVAACLFGGLTVGLTYLGTATSMPVTTNGGPGVFLSAAVVTLLITIGFVPALRRALLRHAYG
ncbi:MAG: hypothetical protein JO016_14745 [Actinobacteria bacterium]|nr:hypothetical protein [Actinomycetota bacterium]